MQQISPIIVSRLEKAAADNGFDLSLARSGEWLAFASTQAPLRVWLSAFGGDVLLVTLSHLDVARALGEYGIPMTHPLPPGALAGRTVTSIPALHQLLRRAFQLSQTLPHQLLVTFEKQTLELPRATEAERLVIQRVGQDVFRKGLLDYWEGRCAVTGLAVTPLLRASHIKPWAVCETDAERLDVFNGLLLAPQLDAAFDRGFISFTAEGDVMVSPRLDSDARDVLGLGARLRARSLEPAHQHYLAWHRSEIFMTTFSK